MCSRPDVVGRTVHRNDGVQSLQSLDRARDLAVETLEAASADEVKLGAARTSAAQAQPEARDLWAGDAI
jgi:hypothetical protein